MTCYHCGHDACICNICEFCGENKEAYGGCRCCPSCLEPRCICPPDDDGTEVA